ncbi:MAG: leucine-rich repeat protein, partial [Halobacteriovoraceae bacterium]|nr:leucine-rich repeat protein [Halobacteriovoraceae bacterium]
VEANNGREESNYFISNQISAYIEETTVSRLSIVRVKDKFISICNRSEDFKSELERILDLDCSAITKNDIKNIYKLVIGVFNSATAEYSIDKLQLHETDLQGFDNLEDLAFNLMNLETIPENLFKYTKNLQALDIPMNLEIFKLDKSIFSDLKKLRSLFITTFNNKNLIEVPDDFFDHLKNLHKITYYSDETLFFNSSVFVGLKNLREMTLDSVNISKIPKELLINKKNLKKIRFSNTHIEELTPYQFSNLTSLTSLMIDWHDIKNIPEYAFAGLTAIQKIDLSHGDIASLDDKSFSQISTGRNKSFLSINLRNNKLTDFDPTIFTSIDSLSLLRLKGNDISPRVELALRKYSAAGVLLGDLK